VSVESSEVESVTALLFLNEPTGVKYYKDQRSVRRIWRRGQTVED